MKKYTIMVREKLTDDFAHTHFTNNINNVFSILKVAIFRNYSVRVIDNFKKKEVYYSVLYNDYSVQEYENSISF